MFKKTSALFCIAMLLPTATYAAPSSADICQERINRALATETRVYRAHLFGVKPAREAPIGDIRYDSILGQPWIKRDDDEWIDSQENLYTDDEMDQLSETSYLLQPSPDGLQARPGVFETKRVLTSTLIPYLIQNIRALSCNIDRICTQVRISLSQEDQTPVPINSIQPNGCKEFTNLVSFPECQPEPEKPTDPSNVIVYCTEVGNQLLEREAALLKLAVEYDAGYRSTLQFAGMFDIFLGELRWNLTGSIRQAASLIGQLNRIPCFLSSCDALPETEE